MAYLLGFMVGLLKLRMERGRGRLVVLEMDLRASKHLMVFLLG
jgi:hypothetical protein